MNRDKFLGLVRREYQEHRMLWLVPVVVAAALVVLALCLSIFQVTGLSIDGMTDGGEIRMLGVQGGPQPDAIASNLAGLARQVFVITAIVCLFYLADCLYGERKDRSILFWKSMPVSDAATVIAKFTTGLFTTPLIAFVSASVVFPVTYGIIASALPDLVAPTGGWSTLYWLRGEWLLLMSLFATLLWYAPLAAWAMLASVAARRAPITYVVLPIVAIGLGERLLFSTSHGWRYIGQRLQPVEDGMAGLARPDLWFGVVVAAVLLYVAIRLRRYRDDT